VKFWSIKAEVTPGQPETLDLMVYGFITSESAWSPSDVAAPEFVRELAAHPQASTINVRINSFGGDAFGGLAIYNALLAHPAKKLVTIEGIAGSAASIIAMAGRVKFARGAMMMIHNPSGGAGGNGSDLRSMADGLDKLADSLATVYQAKTGMSSEKVHELMDAETWLSADEALALGFADEIDETLVVTPTNRAGTVFFNNVGVPADRLPRPLAGGSQMNDKALIAALKALMGLPEGSTNEEILSSYNKVAQGKEPEKKPEPKEEPTPPATPPATSTAPGMQASAELAELCAVLTPEGRASALTAREALVEAIRLRTETVPRSAAPSQVSVALAEGRIAPFEKVALEQMERVAPEGLRAYLATRKPNSSVPLGPSQSRPVVEQAPGVTPEIARLAANAGVDPVVVAERLERLKSAG